jgi:hypothetical protein
LSVNGASVDVMAASMVCPDNRELGDHGQHVELDSGGELCMGANASADDGLPVRVGARHRNLAAAQVTDP